jgi:hypothetical protein
MKKCPTRQGERNRWMRVDVKKGWMAGGSPRPALFMAKDTFLVDKK